MDGFKMLAEELREAAEALEREGPIAAELRDAAMWVVDADCDEHLPPNGMEAPMRRLRAIVERIRKGDCVASQDQGEGSPENSALDEAAHKLWEQFFGNCPGLHPYVQSIGVAENSGTIHVYLVREPMAHERKIPAEVDGYRVESKVIGRIVVGPPVQSD